MILLDASSPDMLPQWIAVGVIVVIAVIWALKRIRRQMESHGGGCGCGCGGDSNKEGQAHCDVSDGCGGCPLVSKCKSPRHNDKKQRHE